MTRTSADITTLLVADGLFDVRSRMMVSPAFVETGDGRILSVGHTPPRADRAARAGRVEIDLTGRWLVPGFVDAHLHLCFDPTTDDCVGRLRAQSDQELRAAMASRAQRAARAGVTTLRDLGDRGFLALDLARSGDPGLPTILTAGPPLTSPGGHCHYLGGEVADAAEAVAVVADHCERGVDLIKVMVTGGILTASSDPGQLQFDQPTVEQIVRAAHERGRPVAAHAHTGAGIRLSFDAGVDTIEHCTFASETEFDLDGQLVDEIARAGCGVCPTFLARPGVDWDPEHFAWRRSVVRALHVAGVQLGAGSDAGVKQGLDHTSIRWAAASFVNAGIPVADALFAMTQGAANVSGVGARKGRLTVGADADIVAVDANPLDDPCTLAEPAFVMMRGAALFAPTMGGTSR